jgi:endonuclease/exonuclease/phosphatase family metal-dependent hydrolase
MRWVRRILIGIVVLVLLLVAAIRLTTFHPPAVASEAVVCPANAPELTPGQAVKVLSWNIQYLAGKDYVFWYDLFDESGPDDRPSQEAIARTLDEVSRVIADEDPDVILLQEVDDGAARTDGEDQLALLLDRLDSAYACHASAFYWKATFVPHPRIMGSVGMKLSTMAKYRIDTATRYQLAQMPNDLLTRQFDIRRAVLETRLPVAGAEDFVVLNTHLDAFAQGSDTMQRQVAQSKNLLDVMTAAGEPWLFAGDLNLLPPGQQYEDLPADQRVYYESDSELAVLTDAYDSFPSLDEANGPDREAWFTHYPNDPAAAGPDRTIDFVFHAPNITLGDHEVRSSDTREISDHFPLVATYTLPGGA